VSNSPYRELHAERPSDEELDLAAAIRESIVSGQETPGQMAERILANPLFTRRFVPRALDPAPCGCPRGWATTLRHRRDCEVTTEWMRAAVAELDDEAP
jgi:hypothetical protein